MPKMILNWERPLYKLHADLAASTSSVADADVLFVIDGIERSLQTNCDSAAQYLFFAIAPICQSKPYLESALLPIALRPLYALGIETEAAVSEWLKDFLARGKPYVDLSESGRTWLERAVSSPNTFQSALSKLVVSGE
ncbi:hypothetical protein [Pseudoduganella sp. R-34]|uniref:hypothetical protein n=1 Tax=Pseudoduganella sp. R-34 TaxID=3404062 RepID=UPI003CF60E1E